MKSLMNAVTAAATLGAAMFASMAPAAAQEQSTWEKIREAGTISYGLIPNRPPYQWEKDGEQAGLAIQMGMDLAEALSKEMGKTISIAYENTGWSTLILDIQSGRVDAFFGMSETEERKKAINMFGPLYAVPVVAVTTRGEVAADTWDAYNSPDHSISVTMGTTEEDALRKYMPKADIRAMKGMAEAILDVQSGNSEALVTSVLLGINAMSKNPNFNKMILLKPAHALPSGGGTRKDSDGKFNDFVNAWAAEYRQSGQVKTVILDSLKEAGFDTASIPADVQF